MKLLRRLFAMVFACWSLSSQAFCQASASGLEVDPTRLQEEYDLLLEEYQIQNADQQRLLLDYQSAYSDAMSNWQHEVNCLTAELQSCEENARRWRTATITIAGVTVGVTLVAVPLLLWRN